MVTNQFPNILYAMVNGTFVPVATLTLTNGGQLVITPSSGGGGGGGYVLPVATTTVLGGVKQGDNVTIDASGVLSVAPPGTGTVDSVVAGTAIAVDITDPANPAVSVSPPPDASVLTAWQLPTNTALSIYTANVNNQLEIHEQTDLGGASFIMFATTTAFWFFSNENATGDFVIGNVNNSGPVRLSSTAPNGSLIMNSSGVLTNLGNPLVIAKDDSTVPSNPVTPVGWVPTIVSGVPSWIPYYQ